jgi:hypothetical protein
VRVAVVCSFAALLVASVASPRVGAPPAAEAGDAGVDLGDCLVAGPAAAAAAPLGELALGDLRIELDGETPGFPRVARPGHAYTLEARGRALRAGRPVAPARVSGAWQVVGFEPVTTPAGSYADSIHIAATRSLEVGARAGSPALAQESDAEIWCVEGVGVVAARTSARLYEDGVLVEQVSDLDGALHPTSADLR